MLIKNLDTVGPSDWVENMSRPREEDIRFASFQVYCNGVLDHVMNAPEHLACDRMRSLRDVYPEDSWEYVPTRHWLDLD